MTNHNVEKFMNLIRGLGMQGLFVILLVGALSLLGFMTIAANI